MDEAMSVGDRCTLAVPIRPHRTSMMLAIAVVDAMTTVGRLEAGGRGIVKTGAFDFCSTLCDQGTCASSRAAA